MFIHNIFKINERTNSLTITFTADKYGWYKNILFDIIMTNPAVFVL